MNRTTKLITAFALAGLLVGCAKSHTKTAIESNTSLLTPAAAVVATDKDMCKSETTTPGFWSRAFGLSQTVSSSVECS